MTKIALNLSEYVKKLRRGEGLGVGKGYLPWLDSRKTKTRGVSSGLSFQGRHHSGLDDTRNIGRLIDHDDLLREAVMNRI